MSRPTWFPPAGAVAVQAGPAINCAACGRTEKAGTPRNAIRMRNNHRCQAGTPGAVPRCPDCLSTDESCVLLDGTRLSTWHPSRAAIAQAEGVTP